MKNGRDFNDSREELYSKAVKAGKRTYFFDVKATKSDDKYITITESKRRFDNDNGKFSYDKHKIFLFKEDFEKFLEGFHEAVGFINGDVVPDSENYSNLDSLDDINFDDLEK